MMRGDQWLTGWMAMSFILLSGCTYVEAESPTPASTTPATATSATVPDAPVEASPEDHVKLSTGVALPQTLPTGTGMSFSVDYQVVQRAEGKGTYEWVLERGQGKPLRQKVELKDKGTLQAIVPEWKPGDEPFHSHLEWVAGSKKGVRVSRSIEMR